MSNDNKIYDVLTRMILGEMTPEDNIVLDAWLAESDANVRMLQKFLKRNDMVGMYSLPRTAVEEKKRMHLRTHWKTIAATVAASIVAAVGLYMWHDYTSVVMPDINEEVMASLYQAEKCGRSDATIIVCDQNGEAVEMAESVSNETEMADIVYADGQKKAIHGLENVSITVETQADKEFWLTLSDGTYVHLNGGSKFTYPVPFTGYSRDVALEGEAYFMVTKDRRHPFIVHTQLGDVKEYGTEFAVNTYYDSREIGSHDAIEGRGLAVTLVSGSISIKPCGGKEQMMVPGEMAMVAFGGNTPQLKAVDLSPLTSWNSGTFAFDVCPLSVLMDVLAKWYNCEVSYCDDNYRNIMFTGEIDRYASVESVLHAINQITGLDLKVEEGKIVVE